MRTIELAYRIEPGAHMAEDENGNPTECYATVKLQNCRDDATAEEIEKAHIEMMSKGFVGIAPQYITPVSIEEYLRETGEDEDDEDEDDWDEEDGE